MEKMKAILITKYDPPEVLVLGEVLKPQPKRNEVSIEVFATAVNSGDCRMRSLNRRESLFLLLLPGMHSQE
jgi:NADPH:quinone reductase-like Zn-dependent oxidoreductase